MVTVPRGTQNPAYSPLSTHKPLFLNTKKPSTDHVEGSSVPFQYPFLLGVGQYPQLIVRPTELDEGLIEDVPGLLVGIRLWSPLR